MEVIYAYQLDDVLFPSDKRSPPMTQRPWGMKMDIEGFESMALRGAKKLLSNDWAPCKIWFQYQRGPTLQSGAYETEIFQTLRQAGYSDIQMIEDGAPVDMETPLDGDYVATNTHSMCQAD